MPKISKILLLSVSVVLVLTVFLGMNSSGVSAATEDQDGAYRQINVYSEVLRHIQTDYVEEPNIPTVTNGALRGLLESLDSDSSYLTPEDYKTFKADKGGKAQVGINVSKRWGYATVVSIVPGSPADKANLSDGDIIEAIGTQDTRDMSVAMIRMMMEGAPGSELAISVVRPRKAAPEKITMTRVVTNMPPVGETMYENSSILYLKPGVLDHEHVQQVESRLKSMQKAGNKKILLDLRDVAAGDNVEAMRMANFLLKTGTIATLEGQKVEKQTFTAESSKAINTTSPVVVLINRGTAGPAEIVAAALMDNKRADLVGEKTFGEGSQQKTFELPDGAALILSVAKYGSPSGKKLEDEGVTPGVMVASNIDDNAPVDEDAATPESPQPETKKPSVSIDEQLNKALDLLKSKAA
ncbi:S41 family peptidase [Edaphobacter modestus]|uniref:Carboxyl-terminal processing protease n=1 Tax=Edaphobacter modestus TaxID=388466 RepID=A0A4Q7YZK8_9BACT|nr:S41 family peptidase [Edaphobacter modestus]RZU42673.1 carboxyl-terminal processing protease [Edaphobacter modestus]